VANVHRDTRLVAVQEDADGLRAAAWQGTAMLRGLAQACALALVPPGGVGAGDGVQALLVPW